MWDPNHLIANCGAIPNNGPASPYKNSKTSIPAPNC